MNPMISGNVRDIYSRMSSAAVRAGRSPGDIQLIAVTKNVGSEVISDAFESGLTIFGENRVQEAQKKIRSAVPGLKSECVQWHLIGHLQKNKAKTAVELFDMIQSVDSIELAGLINGCAESIGKIQRILLQVKLSHEESKHGINKDNILILLRALERMTSLRVEGLMTIPPYFEKPEDVRPFFSELRKLRDETCKQGFLLTELSMGMSHDFEIAIEEGATMVRIGTAIFGERATI
jgi:pyridoxal phosphate enzyme (YggS family)